MRGRLCEKRKSKAICGGSAFTRYVCQICGVPDRYHMTCVPKICGTCSQKYKKCERCMEEIGD